MSEYFIKHGKQGKQQGPFNTSQLKALAAKGQVVDEDLISMDKQKWFPARKVKGLFPKDVEGCVRTDVSSNNPLIQSCPKTTDRVGKPMTMREAFSASEWDAIQNGIIFAFLLVAGSDGKIDSKEVEAFVKKIAGASNFKSQIAQEALSSLENDFDKVFHRVIAIQPSEGVLCITKIADILDAKAPTDEKEAFKAAIILLLLEVANASGGWFFGLGNKVSAEEKKRIELVATLLRCVP